MKSFALARAASLGLLMFASISLAQTAPATNAPPPSITGTMDINYVTRTPQGQEEGNAKLGVQDTYSVSLVVNGTNKFEGKISRQPRIKGTMGLRTVQQPRYDYNLNISVNVKGQDRTVGQWVGPLAVDEKTGAFNLTADGDRALRMAVTAGSGFEDKFGGTFYGKAEDKSKLSWDTLTRTINGKTVEKKFQADNGREPTETEAAKIREWVLANVRGTVQADILKEDQGQNTCIFSTEFSLKVMGDIQEYFVHNRVRNFYSVSISGYHIAEAGANPPTAQRMGEAAGNFIGFGAVALLAFMGAASYAGAPVVQWLASLLKALVH